MRTSSFNKCLSLFLSLIMIITMLPVSVISFADENYPEMMEFTVSSIADFHRYYNQVHSVTFLDEIDKDAMAEALYSWDISANTDSGEVMSWMYLNEEATAAAGANRYDVYIAGDGGVAANSQSGYIFYMFENLEEVNGAENFKTSNATTLKSLFYRCYKLKTIDLSSWDTSNVTDMSQLFDMTTSTGSTIVPALETVNLSGWDTSKVTTMSYMFNNCKSLIEADLSSFDTNNVTNMEHMFYLCISMEQIYIGDKWTVANVTSDNAMFNCCYALVGGKDKYDKDFQYIPPGKEHAKLKEDGGFLTHEREKPEPEKKEYKVTYEFIGNIIPDKVTLTPEKVYKEGSVVTLASLPEADGYEFSGWATDDADISSGSFIINNDVHIVGSWEKLYTVTYKYDDNYEIPDNAPVLPSYQFKAGDAVSVDSLPFIDGYVFEGWTTSDVTIESNFFEMPEKDVVFYGYFKRPVASVEINSGDLLINIDEEAVINVTVRPDDATVKDIVYSSDNEDVVKIDENGKITTVGAGTAKITVYTKDDPTKYDEITVTVKIPVTDIEVDKDKITLNKSETEKINVTVIPTNATNKTLEFKSDNENVVTIDEFGNITATGEGTTTIIITSEDNPEVKEIITVNVKIPVERIIVSDDSLELEIGDNDKITAIITPDNATDKDVIFESSNEDIVKVDEHGNITAVGEGTATIKVSSIDDLSKYDEVIITVKKPVPPEEITTHPEETTTESEETTTESEETTTESEEITTESEKTTEPGAPTTPDEPTLPNDGDYVIEVPEKLVILAGVPTDIIKVTPGDAKVNVTFSSADVNIAFIDANGRVIGILPGSTTVYADFGNGDIRAITVIVIAPVDIPQKFHICFGKTDGIGWYEVSINGEDFFPQGPNSTLEVNKGDVLIIRIQDLWIDDDFEFYVNGFKVPETGPNQITVVVDGFMLIGALSMDISVPDIEESLTLFEKIINAIKAFFAMIESWFK